MVTIMLKRLLIVLFLAAFLPGDAVAQTITVREFYVRELREDGYDSIRISRTFLGRLRFTGSQPGRRREIIVNPSNGAVLRDFVRLIEDELEGGGAGSKPPYPGGGSYEDEDDDDYDDDEDDRDDEDDDDDDRDDNDDDEDEDDDDSDNSGSGSSNCGSGSDDDDDD